MASIQQSPDQLSSPSVPDTGWKPLPLGPQVESLGGREPSAEFVERVPIHFARQHGVLGLVGDDGRLPVAVADEKLAGAWDALQVVSRFLGRPVQPIVAPARLVSAAINDAYERRT